MSRRLRKLAKHPMKRRKGNNFQLVAPVLMIGAWATQSPAVLAQVLPRNPNVVQGANLPTTVGNAMTIQQTQPRAIINWDAFSVGANASVRFDQGGNSSWAVLNRVVGNEPSVVQGRLQADGTVYLINRNGIVIGQGAVIDVGSFLGSTMNITDKIFRDGILSVAGTAPVMNAADAASRPTGTIRIEPDAIIQARSGGQIFFFASGTIYDAAGNVLPGRPTLENNGTLRAPDGQIILASGDRIFLRAADGRNIAREANLFGLVVQADDGGQVANGLLGLLEAKRGNITLAGLFVNQQGRASATTSVDRGGSVWLLARPNTGPRPGASAETPSVEFGSGSRTSVTADTDTRATGSVDAQFRQTDGSLSRPQSTINVDAQSIRLRGSAAQGPGAIVSAPSGTINLTAQPSGTNVATTPLDGLPARILVEQGAKIDVSGLRDVAVALERNSVRVELRNEQLSEAPLLRDSAIRGQAVFLDARRGTAAARFIGASSLRDTFDASIQRGVEERLTPGGTINLISTGDVILQPGSVMGISGGNITYGAGQVDTSRLFDGRRYYGIETATAQRRYLAVDTVQGAREQGYAEGANGGTLAINARNLAYLGQAQGGAVIGPNQRPTPPSRGRVLITEFNGLVSTRRDFGLRHGFRFVNGASGPVTIDDSVDLATSSAQIFGAVNAPIDQAISLQGLAQSQLSEFRLRTNGGLATDAATTLRLAPETTFNLLGSQILWNTSVHAPASRLILTGTNTFYDSDPGNLQTPQLDHPVVVGPGVALNVSGEWINERPLARAGTVNPTDAVNGIKGGRVEIVSNTGIEFGANTSIDASAGAWINSAGRLTTGDSLRTNSGEDKAAISLVVQVRDDRDPNAATGTLVQSQRFPVAQTRLVLPTTISGFGFRTGADLTLGSGQFGIGNSAPLAAYGNRLDTGFFSNGGFSSYRLIGLNGVALGANENITLRQQNLTLALPAYQETGDALRTRARIETLPDALRTATNLSLEANGVDDGITRVAAGSRIQGDIGSRISLSAGYRVEVEGQINAPAGTVNLTAGAGSIERGFRPDLGVQIGDGAAINVDGTSRISLDSAGRRAGDVLAGGTISVSADPGTVVMSQGASLSAAGSSATLDLANGQGRRVPQEVSSNGGTIRFNGRLGAYIAGSLNTRAGGAGASAGRVDLGFGSADLPLMVFDGGLLKAVVDASNITDAPIGSFIYSYFPYGERRFWIAPQSAAPVLQGGARADLDRTFNGTRPAGFTDPAWATRPITFFASQESLNGHADIKLEGANVTDINAGVSLAASTSINLDSPALRMQAGSSTVTAPFIQVGRSVDRPLALAAATPSTSGQSLTFTATNTIQLQGDLQSRGIQDTVFNAEESIRFSSVVRPSVNTVIQRPNSTIVAEGNVQLNAPITYATTLANVNFTTPGNLSFGRYGSRAAITPLSAYGSLVFNATNITQDGDLRVPFGTLSLNATQNLDLRSSSYTSVNGAGALVPVGSLSNSREVLYSLNSFESLVLTAPSSRISLNGTSIRTQANASGQAVVDASGSGDTFAAEFVRGPLGSADFLAPTRDASGRITSEVFAILPGYTSSTRPFDLGAETNTALRPGQQIELTSNSVLPEGRYTLLPAQYALLPDAVAVRITTPRDATATNNLIRPDGVSIVAARQVNSLAGTAESRTLTAELYDPTQLRLRSEYVETTGTRLFSAEANRTDSRRPQLPVDGGVVTVNAQTQLLLDGAIRLGSGTLHPGTANTDRRLDAQLQSQAQRGDLNLSANEIEVVGPGQNSSSPNAVAINVAALNNAQARRLTIGGAVSEGASPNTLVGQVNASQVRVASGVEISAEQITLLGRDSVSLGSGSTVRSTGGSAGQAPQALSVTGTAAVVLASNRQTTLERSAFSNTSGDLTIAAGATIRGAQVLADASRLASIDAQSTLAASQTLSVGSDRVFLGTPGGTLGGLVVTPALQAAAANAALELRGYQDIAVFGSSTLNTAGAMRLFTPRITATGPGASLDIGATTFEWASPAVTSLTAARPVPSAAIASTQLRITASGTTDQAPITIGTGTKTIDGFASTAITAGTASGPRRDVVLTSGASNGQEYLVNSGDLTLRADRVAGQSLAQHSIVAGGALVTQTVGNGTDPALTAAGSRVELRGTSVAIGNRIQAHSGEILAVATTGDVELRQGAALDVRSFDQPIKDERLALDAGRVTLQAAGSVTTLAGSSINLNAASSNTSAGRLTASAASGTTNLANASISAQSSQGRGGELVIDAAQGLSLDAISQQARNAGFTERFNVRQRNGAVGLTSGNTVSSREVDISTDNGALNIDGAINASNGSITLSQAGSGQALTLGANSRLDASGGVTKVGQIKLQADSMRFANGSSVSTRAANGTAGELLIRSRRDDSTGAIDVAGVSAGNLTVLDNTAVQVDAYRVYQFGGAAGSVGTIGVGGSASATRFVFSGTPTSLQADAENFAANQAAAAAAALPVVRANAQALNAVVKPGIEVRSASRGSITVSDNLNFATINTGTGAAATGGYFTLRAEGNVNLTGTTATAAAPTAVLADGRTTATAFTFTPGGHWSYRIAGGANLSSGNPLSVRTEGELAAAGITTAGDVVVPNHKQVFTGNGDIDFAAGRDIRLGTTTSTTAANQVASIFTFGQEAAPLAGFTPATGSTYGVNGGNVSLNAGRDVLGSNAGQYGNFWIYRQGASVGGSLSQDTGWWTAPAAFRMNVGALAGGDVVVRSGRDVTAFTVGQSSIGRLPAGGSYADTVREGRGDLVLESGRTLTGGQVVNMRGNVQIQANDSMLAGVDPGATTATLAMPLGLGESQATISARRNLDFSRSYNPTHLPRAIANSSSNPTQRDLQTLFSTFTPDTSLTLSSAGNLNWRNETFRLTATQVSLGFRNLALDSLQAPTLRATAATGTISVPLPATLTPTSRGSLTLLAGTDIVGGAGGSRIGQPGTEFETIIGPDQPLTTDRITATSLQRLNFRPDPAYDSIRDPARIYAGRDIGLGSVRQFSVNMSRPVSVSAGRDVINFSVDTQNLLPTDETRIEAGRDVRYTINRLPSGAFDIVGRDSGFRVAGPGHVVVRAGRNVDLGLSYGVETIGNTRNGDLPAGGAGIVVIAGLTSDPDYAAVIATYIDPAGARTSPRQSEALIAYVRDITGDTSITTAAAAYSRFQTLPQSQRDAYARTVFLREVRIGGGPDTDGLIDRFIAPTSGRGAGGSYGTQLIDFVNASQGAGTAPVADADAAWAAFLALPTVKRAEFVGQVLIPATLADNQLRRDDPMFRDYPRAFRALATMYPQDGQGNVEVQFSKIRATQGGSVQVMAPGSVCREASGACADSSFGASANPAVGNVFTGVPNPPASIVNDPLKGPSQLGLFGLNNASIDIIAGSNVSVFGNRIVTVGSGNLMGWSSYGNIDAGRGSRAAVSAPAPTITVDSAGNVIVELGGAVQGSGIRAVTVGSQLAGEVSLYAPQGFIDAGDAGIQGGAVFIAANQVINAENIRVGDGITKAVALGDLGGSVNLGSVSSSASSAASGAAQQAASQAAASASDRANRRNRIIVVEFEGFGTSAADEQDQNSRRRQQGPAPR